MQNEGFKNFLKLLKFDQSGEFLPNLVTLIVTQNLYAQLGIKVTATVVQCNAVAALLWVICGDS